MARRKKPKAHDDEAVAAQPRPAPEKLNRPFAEALRDMRAQAVVRPKPVAAPPAKEPKQPAPPRPSVTPPKSSGRPKGPLGGYSYEDRAAFQQAFAGVRPLKSGAQARALPHPRPAAAVEDAREVEARRRLDRLVAGEARFEVHRESDGAVSGQRRGAHPSHLRALEGGVAPQATLDLHGLSGDAAEREVGRFVREQQRKGDRVLLVVHGKGNHSEGAIGVLQDRAIRALTKGGAAALVLAFRSAPERLGGLGALVVRLAER
jgi:DNA-nicking Smr family endonuclease